jgi:hypothetical protein
MTTATTQINEEGNVGRLPAVWAGCVGPADLGHASAADKDPIMRTITGLFDSRPEAERAVETLVQQHGLARDRIQVRSAGSDNATAGTMSARSEDHHGFHVAETGDAAGGIMVSVLVPDEQAAVALDALVQNGGKSADGG